MRTGPSGMHHIDQQSEPGRIIIGGAHRTFLEPIFRLGQTCWSDSMIRPRDLGALERIDDEEGWLWWASACRFI